MQKTCFLSYVVQRGARAWFVLFSTLCLLPVPVRAVSVEAADPSSVQLVADVSVFEASSRKAGLPLARVESYQLPQASGTAILIPQFHRQPGSNAADQVNDSPERAQRQIAALLPSIINFFSTQLVMVEGIQLSGVPAEYVRALQEKQTAISALEQGMEMLAGREAIDPEHAPAYQKARKQLEQAKQNATRELLLEGAPFQLMAQGQRLTIVGPENPQTQAEAAGIVARYMALKKSRPRAKTAVSSAPVHVSSLQGRFHASERSRSLWRLLQQARAVRPLNTLEEMMEKNNKKDEGKIAEQIPLWQSAIAVLKKPLPARMVLPASSSEQDQLPSDPAQVRRELAHLETEIQRVIIDQRNRETAGYFRQALEESGQSYGIIQYGAGHQEGLVKELQAKNLSVMVIVPQEVEERQALSR
jgi:hypothetical protein